MGRKCIHVVGRGGRVISGGGNVLLCHMPYTCNSTEYTCSTPSLPAIIFPVAGAATQFIVLKMYVLLDSLQN